MLCICAGISGMHCKIDPNIIRTFGFSGSVFENISSYSKGIPLNLQKTCPAKMWPCEFEGKQFGFGETSLRKRPSPKRCCGGKWGYVSDDVGVGPHRPASAWGTGCWGTPQGRGWAAAGAGDPWGAPKWHEPQNNKVPLKKCIWGCFVYLTPLSPLSPLSHSLSHSLHSFTGRAQVKPTEHVKYIQAHWA